jgi:nucleoporin SEH1
MSKAAAFLADPPTADDRPSFETIIKHGHQDLVQAVAFNGHGDRCATGSVDGKIRVFNRHKDGSWRLCDTWGAHASEILEVPIARISLTTLLPGNPVLLSVSAPH